MSKHKESATILHTIALLFLITLPLYMMGCSYLTGPEEKGRGGDEWNREEQTAGSPKEHDQDHEVGDGWEDALQLTLVRHEDQEWISASELAEVSGGSLEVDEVDGTARLILFDLPFFLVKGVPVVERNGLYLPYELEPYFTEEDVLLPLDFLEQALAGHYRYVPEEKAVYLQLDDEAVTAFNQEGQTTFDLEQLSPDDLIQYLSFISSPLQDAHISTQESHLPGAPRPYRNGYHEGIDWYGGVTGVEIGLDTPVLSVADGVVVRADHDYVEMDAEEREEYLQLAARLDDTPAYILDKLRGRSVWVQYDQGVMVRYVHLSAIEEGLQVGQEVKQGQVLGYVGNSGTSHAVSGETEGGLHLHADLLIYGEPFWIYLDGPDEIRYVLEHIFEAKTTDERAKGDRL